MTAKFEVGTKYNWYGSIFEVLDRTNETVTLYHEYDYSILGRLNETETYEILKDEVGNEHVVIADTGVAKVYINSKNFN